MIDGVECFNFEEAERACFPMKVLAKGHILQSNKFLARSLSAGLDYGMAQTALVLMPGHSL